MNDKQFSAKVVDTQQKNEESEEMEDPLVNRKSKIQVVGVLKVKNREKKILEDKDDEDYQDDGIESNFLNSEQEILGVKHVHPKKKKLIANDDELMQQVLMPTFHPMHKDSIGKKNILQGAIKKEDEADAYFMMSEDLSAEENKINKNKLSASVYKTKKRNDLLSDDENSESE